jgi:hypothetical protein
MTYKTFEAINKNSNCTLIFDGLVSVPVKDFTIGFGFETIASLPTTTQRRLIEVFSFLHLNDFVKGSNAEHLNNEYEKALKKYEK